MYDEIVLFITAIHNKFSFCTLPSKFHQSGQSEASFTTPLENTKRKRSQRTVQNVTESLGVLFLVWLECQNGATITHKKPASNNRLSLKILIKNKFLIFHDMFAIQNL